MREILFRGKRTDNGEWVYGCLIFAPNYNCILQDEEKVHPMDFPYLNGELGVIDGTVTPVDPETVGQYTGLTDKNGKKIFEGDILKSYEYDDVFFIKYFDTDNYPAFDCVPDVPLCECNGLAFLVNEEGCEVVGNIYDNPEQFGIVEQLKGE